MLHETLEYLGIAFISSVLLIIISKIILQALIRRPADYYDARELEQEELMLNAAGISLASEHETNPEGEIIEESHLEAHHTDFEAVQPEEIMEEVSESVAESLVTFVHDSLPDDDEDFIEEDNEEDHDEAAAGKEEESGTEEETEGEPVIETETENVKSEDAAEEDAEPVNSEDAAEEDAEPVNSEDAAEEDAEPVKPEDAAEEDAEPVNSEVVAQADAEPEPDQAEFEVIPETDEPVGFSIKAKTSRRKRPKKHEEEEAAEELELARAAMEEARKRDTAHEAGTDEAAADSAESMEEIRSSLEKAFVEHSKKPSMRMTKKQLTEIAESLGIEIPAGATKKIILELINSVREEQQ